MKVESADSLDFGFTKGLNAKPLGRISADKVESIGLGYCDSNASPDGEIPTYKLIGGQEIPDLIFKTTDFTVDFLTGPDRPQWAKRGVSFVVWEISAKSWYYETKCSATIEAEPSVKDVISIKATHNGGQSIGCCQATSPVPAIVGLLDLEQRSPGTGTEWSPGFRQERPYQSPGLVDVMNLTASLKGIGREVDITISVGADTPLLIVNNGKESESIRAETKVRACNWDPRTGVWDLALTTRKLQVGEGVELNIVIKESEARRGHKANIPFYVHGGKKVITGRWLRVLHDELFNIDE